MLRSLGLTITLLLPGRGGTVEGDAPQPSAREWRGFNPTSVTRLESVAYERADQVVGNGTPLSVTLEKLQTAIDRGGGQVTPDGLEQNRILQEEWKTELAVQRLRFVNGRTAEDGAGIYVTNWDSTLTVIDCHFENCQTTDPDRDIGGGTIRALGQRHLLISGSTFIDCTGANGGAIGKMDGQLTVVGCRFQGDLVQLKTSDNRLALPCSTVMATSVGTPRLSPRPSLAAETRGSIDRALAAHHLYLLGEHSEADQDLTWAGEHRTRVEETFVQE